jgi:CxxC-x17-CxxC domain-containing protein
MGDFKRNNKFGGGRGGSFGGKSFGGGHSSGRSGFGHRDRDDKPQMFKAVCDDCGAPCEVPFRPSGTRPVFCRPCFEKGGEGKGAPRNNDSYRDNRNDSYKDNRRDSFKAPSFNAPQKENSTAQYDILNAKLDKILKLLTPATATPDFKEKTDKSEKMKVAEKVGIVAVEKEGAASEEKAVKTAKPRKTKKQ